MQQNHTSNVTAEVADGFILTFVTPLALGLLLVFL